MAEGNTGKPKSIDKMPELTEEQTLIGKTFTIREGSKKGLQFTVMESVKKGSKEERFFFPEGKHDKQNAAYLDGVKRGTSDDGKKGEGGFLQMGQLTSVFYQSWATPLVRIPGGVVKLSRIKIGDEIVTGAHDICAKLDLLETRQAVSLEEVGNKVWPSKGPR